MTSARARAHHEVISIQQNRPIATHPDNVVAMCFRKMRLSSLSAALSGTYRLSEVMLVETQAPGRGRVLAELYEPGEPDSVSSVSVVLIAPILKATHGVSSVWDPPLVYAYVSQILAWNLVLTVENGTVRQSCDKAWFNHVRGTFDSDTEQLVRFPLFGLLEPCLRRGDPPTSAVRWRKRRTESLVDPIAFLKAGQLCCRMGGGQKQLDRILAHIYNAISGIAEASAGCGED
ncbi:hypothetical protein GGX14DRAFT_406229 [Mycena pura]|uniref:Uncharacterized protein n=1 Tax=Mycena pura TaxID=153505 RepID=A0AAD6Y5N3_9AGAR|nr:hypothetical protein GGX14DRAFT_406229 [Mycena pura]